jgi:hypothetical protein
MAIRIRIARTALADAREMLARPHAFAWERIGFFFGKDAPQSDGLVVLSEFESVADENYERDRLVGACVGRAAIIRVMQRALTDQVSVFHTHIHPHRGLPWFSSTDLESLPGLVHSVRNVRRSAIHGGLLLSHDREVALAWRPGADTAEAVRDVTTVGFPMKIPERTWR